MPSNQNGAVSNSCHHCVQAPHGFELVQHWLSELDLPSEVGSSGSQPGLLAPSGLADPGSQSEDDRGASGMGLPMCTLHIQLWPCQTRWALAVASWICLLSQVWLALAAPPGMSVHLVGTACLASHCPQHVAPYPPLDPCESGLLLIVQLMQSALRAGTVDATTFIRLKM